MIRAVDDRVEVSGPVTIAGAAGLLAEGITAMTAHAANVAEFDLAGVTEVDSSGLAVVFGWMRAAQASDKSVRLINLPQNFLSLAAVYGVADLLPQH